MHIRNCPYPLLSWVIDPNMSCLANRHLKTWGFWDSLLLDSKRIQFLSLKAFARSMNLKILENLVFLEKVCHKIFIYASSANKVAKLIAKSAIKYGLLHACIARGDIWSVYILNQPMVPSSLLGLISLMWFHPVTVGLNLFA